MKPYSFRYLLPATVALTVIVQTPWAEPTMQFLSTSPGSASPLLDPANLVGLPIEFPVQAVSGTSGRDALNSLSHGRWARACSIASGILARQVADVDALGIFALCAAISGDRKSAITALARLQEAETTPYFGLLTEGVLRLLDQQPEKAQVAWGPTLQARRDDPLTQYFEGEALYAQRRTVQAVAAFRATLKTWPDFAPALTALARITSNQQASKNDLKAALSMAERATQIEPMNLNYWRLLADLCRRNGQEARAEAITLQHLRLTLPTTQ